jgi:NADH-quinone oxidoreductase subunit C
VLAEALEANNSLTAKTVPTAKTDSTVNNEQLFERISAKFDTKIQDRQESYGMMVLTVDAKEILDILRFLQEDEEINMNFLTDICGIHEPDRPENELGVVYHLHNWTKNVRLRLKAYLPKENPQIASATPLFASANWMERETYDFYGINFLGHPDLRRILNVDDMDYFPMRKEYALEDGTRTDKDDRYFGRQGHEGRSFEKRADRA